MYLKSIAVNATGYGVILDVYPNGTDIRFVDTTEVGIGRVELTLDADRCKHYVEVTREQFDQITNGLTVGDATPVSGGYIRQRWHTGEHKEVSVNYLAKCGALLHTDPKAVVSEIESILDTEKLDDYRLMLNWVVKGKNIYFEYPLKDWCVDSNFQFPSVSETLKAIFGYPKLTEETMRDVYIKALEHHVLRYEQDRKENNLPAMQCAFSGIVRLASQVGGNMARLALEVSPDDRLQMVVDSAVESIASALVERGNVKEQNAGAFGQHPLQFQPMQRWPQPFEPGFQRGEMPIVSSPYHHRF